MYLLYTIGTALLQLDDDKHEQVITCISHTFKNIKKLIILQQENNFLLLFGACRMLKNISSLQAQDEKISKILNKLDITQSY